MLQAYFRIFTGSAHVASIDLQTRLPERVAVLTLSALLLGGGLYPQPGVASRYNAATQLVKERDQRLAEWALSFRTSRNAAGVASNVQ